MKPLTISRGRIVDYHCGEGDEIFNPGPDGLVSAFVTFVNPDNSLNLTVFGTDGRILGRTGVAFFGVSQTLPESGRYCLWPEAVIRMEESAKRFEQSLLDRGTTLEQAAAGNFSGANEATVKKASDETVHEVPPVHREPTISDQADPAATDATLDAAQKSDATGPEATEMTKAEAGALSS